MSQYSGPVLLRNTPYADTVLYTYDVPRNAQCNAHATHRAVCVAYFEGTPQNQTPTNSLRRTGRTAPDTSTRLTVRTAYTNVRIAHRDRTARAHARCRSNRCPQLRVAGSVCIYCTSRGAKYLQQSSKRKWIEIN